VERGMEVVLNDDTHRIPLRRENMRDVTMLESLVGETREDRIQIV